MKKIFLVITLFLAFFAFISVPSVVACHFDDVVITADCEGFSISGLACINGEFHEGVDIKYDLAVNYTDASGVGMVVPVFGFGTRILQEPGVNDCKPFEISGAWEAEFCGDVIINGTVDLVSINHSSETDSVALETEMFFCPCACTRTPGYYKKSDHWPDGVDSLMIGGVVYTKRQLILRLKMPVRGDMAIKLSQHLIAAMLNVINVPGNNTPLIQLYISMANSYFADPTGCDKHCAEDMKDVLDEFNNSGEYWCDIEEDEKE